MSLCSWKAPAMKPDHWHSISHLVISLPVRKYKMKSVNDLQMGLRMGNVPQGHGLEYLVPGWWHCLGEIMRRSCSPAGGCAPVAGRLWEFVHLLYFQLTLNILKIFLTSEKEAQIRCLYWDPKTPQKRAKCVTCIAFKECKLRRYVPRADAGRGPLIWW